MEAKVLKCEVTGVYPPLVAVKSSSTSKIFLVDLNGYLELSILKIDDRMTCIGEFSDISNEEGPDPALSVPEIFLGVTQTFRVICRPLVYIPFGYGNTFNFLKSNKLELKNCKNEEEFRELLSSISIQYTKKKIGDMGVMDMINLYCTGLDRGSKVKTKISSRRCSSLLFSWKKDYDNRQLKLFGITDDEIEKLDMCDLFKSKQKLIRVIIDDPIRAYEISIDRAKKICDIMGRKTNNQQEQYGMACRYIWNKAKNSRMVSVRREELDIYNKVSVDALGTGWRLTEVCGRFYMTDILELEILIATRISELFKAENVSQITNTEKIDMYCNDLGMSVRQTEGIKLVVSQKVSVISGEAGSGKSTMLRALVGIIRSSSKSVCLLAPTGIAVDRIRERLQIFGQEKYSSLKDHIQTVDLFRVANTETYDWVIVDESSMLSYDLVSSLLCKIPNTSSVVFIGDNNQLPPIGIGNFFEQIVSFKGIPNVFLEENFRSLYTNDPALETARSIIKNEFTQFKSQGNISVIPGDLDTVKIALIKAKEAGRDKKDISVLSPYKDCIPQINDIFCEVFGITGSGMTGKRVMMTKNFNKKKTNIMNGEQGIVIGEDRDSLKVEFKGAEYTFLRRYKKDFLCASDLAVSYCRTIHKAQGDECPLIIIYFRKTSNFSFCNKSLMYTAMTRQKERVMIIGDIGSMNSAARSNRPYDGSQLADMLRSERFLGVK